MQLERVAQGGWEVSVVGDAQDKALSNLVTGGSALIEGCTDGLSTSLPSRSILQFRKLAAPRGVNGPHLSLCVGSQWNSQMMTILWCAFPCRSPYEKHKCLVPAAQFDMTNQICLQCNTASLALCDSNSSLNCFM